MALVSLPGLGHKGLRALVDTYGENLGHVWEDSPGRIQRILTRARVPQAGDLALRLVAEAPRWIEQGQAEVQRLAEQKVHILSPKALPRSLQEIPDPPRWLFVEGNPEILQHKPVVAVVGTRKPSEEGKRAARVVAEILAAYPVVVVSGLAEGIDAVAHGVSLQEGVPNVAFLGHGIRLVFPRATASLRRRIVAQGGAVATEYLPNERYSRSNFVARNRLQAALADLVIPVEGQTEGGTAHTVRFARRYGRRVITCHWNGCGSLANELTRVGIETINPFTADGRRRLDEYLRDLARQANHDTWALHRVGRLLEREAETRHILPDDLERLRRQVDALSVKLQGVDSSGHDGEGNSV